MLCEARGKGIYDELHAAALTAYLRHTHRRFDLFLAADVFVYIGDLAPLFQAVARHRRPGAWFVFSSEAGSEADYVLQETGRYAHSAGYISRLAARCEACVERAERAAVRHHAGRDVPSRIHVLRFADPER